MSTNIKAAELEVGTEVATVKYDSWSEKCEIRLGTVTKITKTRVIVTMKNGEREYDHRWVVSPYGDLRKLENRESYNSPHLYLADSEAVVTAGRHNERWEAKVKARNALTEFTAKFDRATGADVDEFIQALEAYKIVRSETAGV